jgi:hypothetical protein
MTDATATPTPLLWTDERINELIKAVLSKQPNHTPRGLARRVAYTVRDDMSGQIAALEQERDLLAHALLLAAGCIEDGGIDKWQLGIADDVELALRVTGRNDDGAE